jgi:hypothetical protein
MASQLLYRVIASLSLLLFLVDGVIGGCFLPNGTDINKLRGGPNQDYFLPCNSGGGDSMCCRTNSTGPDTCLSNGLCHNDREPNTWR